MKTINAFKINEQDFFDHYFLKKLISIADVMNAHTVYNTLEEDELRYIEHDHHHAIDTGSQSIISNSLKRGRNNTFQLKESLEYLFHVLLS